MDTDDVIVSEIKSLKIVPSSHASSFDESILTEFVARRRRRRNRRFAGIAATMIALVCAGITVQAATGSHGAPEAAARHTSGSSTSRGLNLGPATGCSSPLSFTLTGAQSGVLTSTSGGLDVAASFVQVRSATINQLLLIVGKPGTVPGVGSANTDARLSGNQIAMNSVSGVTDNGSIDVPVTGVAPGTYPVIVDVTYSDIAPCGGEQADHLTVSSEIGRLVVSSG